MKHLMSGNEATARGVYEAGIKICSAYPGTLQRFEGKAKRVTDLRNDPQKL